MLLSPCFARSPPAAEVGGGHLPRFLAFAGNSTVVEKLNERQFRAYWDRTTALADAALTA